MLFLGLMTDKVGPGLWAGARPSLDPPAAWDARSPSMVNRHA
jgi:hypothetical protein